MSEEYCGGHCGACDEKHRDWEAKIVDLEKSKEMAWRHERNWRNKYDAKKQQVTQQAATISQLRDALEELCDGIEGGGGTDGNGDTFDLTKAIAALASIPRETK